MDSPDRIRYISRDTCGKFPKEVVYMYYLAEGRDDEEVTVFANRNQSSFNGITESDIVKRLNDKIKSISSVTGYVRIWKKIEGLRKDYPSLVKDFRLLPSYTCIPSSMCGVNDPKLDNILVWEMNAIHPEITGYFFENMLAHTLNLTYKKDTSVILRRKDANITIDQFEKMMKRIHAEKEHYIKDPDGNDRKCYTTGANVDEDEYDEIEAILDASVLAYLEKNNMTEMIHVGIHDLYKYIYRYIDQLNNYLHDLGRSTIVRSMSREIGIEHSKPVGPSSEFPIHGEIDFCSNSYITDAKCCKTDDELGWFIQLYLYRALLDNHALRLRIINFNTNKVYEFSILNKL